MVTQKILGLTVIVVALLLLVLGGVYVRSAEAALLQGHQVTAEGECLHPAGARCAYEELSELALPKYIGAFAALALLVFGVVLYFWKRPADKAVANARKETTKLDGEEKTAMDHIIASGGMMFQNELAAKLEASKVKTTRILDKLEFKGLIERKRRGMTNLVVLKQ